MKCQPIKPNVKPISFKSITPKEPSFGSKLVTVMIKEEPKMDVFKKCPQDDGQE